MMRRLRFLRRHRSRPRPFAGQSIVEFALISLTLLTMTFGILDFGRAVMTRSMLTNAVREAARAGALNPKTATATAGGVSNAAIIEAAAKRSPSLGLTDPSVAQITVTCSTWGRSGPTPPAQAPEARACNTESSGTLYDTDDKLQVCINYSFNLVAGRLIGFRTLNMAECGRARIL